MKAEAWVVVTLDGDDSKDIQTGNFDAALRRDLEEMQRQGLIRGFVVRTAL